MNAMRSAMSAAVAAATMLVLATVGAAGASAITVANEDESPNQGVACGAVTVNGHSVTQNGEDCVIHAVQAEPIDLEVLGIKVATCNNEFSAVIGSNGLGAIVSQTLTDVTADSCGTTPCNESGSNDPWPITQQTELNPDNNWRMRVTFCVVAPVIGVMTCTIDIPYVVNGHTSAVFGPSGQAYTCIGASTRQVHGSWITEDVNDDDIEVRH